MMLYASDTMSVRLTVPTLLVYHKNVHGDTEWGLCLRHCDTGVYVCHYDYGHVVRVQLLGVGVDVWWMCT